MKSPLDIERSMLKFESNIVQLLFRSSNFKVIFVTIILFLIYLTILIPMAGIHVPFNLRESLFTQRTDIYIVLGLGALISFYLKSEFRFYFFIFLLFVSWILPFLYRGVWEFSILAYPLLACAFYLISLINLNKFLFKLVAFLLGILSFLMATYWMLKASFGKSGVAVSAKFWLTHPEFYVLFFLTVLLSNANKEFKRLLLNPMNLVWGTIWPQDTLLSKNMTAKEHKKLWCRGIYSVAVSILFFFIALFVRYLLKDSKLSLISTVIFYYFFYLFMIIGSFNGHVGISRMLGINCPDATYFLLLAKTPMEVWQRGSTYVYKFFLNFIYIPLQRKIKNYFLVMLICMCLIVLHLFIFHDVVIRNFFFWLIPDLKAPIVPVLRTLVFSVSWAGLWFVWILVGGTVWRRILILLPRPWLQWSSILMNHIVIASIYPISNIILTPYLLEILN
ncbi:MAG: hypothetical protein KDD58_07880 [Bdellovibrionales bacterium]|nr:hypothetical protein [Bdellovibrionales bacterium]